MQFSFEPNFALNDEEKGWIKTLIDTQDDPEIAVIRYVEALLIQAFKMGREYEANEQ